MITNYAVYLGLVLCLFSSTFANTAPTVSNVTASQRTDGSGYVDISYTLKDADNDKCTVSVLVSNDGGNTWTIIPASSALSGDRANVAPGRRKISWNSKVDLPGAFGSNYCVKVSADDAQEIFRDDFRGSLTWSRSDNSVYLKDNEYLYIGNDSSDTDYAEKSFDIILLANKQMIIEQRIKLASGGLNYRLPSQEVYFEDMSKIDITYLPNDPPAYYGWHFMTWTGITNPGIPGTGWWSTSTANYWAVTKLVLTQNGGQLYMKPDDIGRGWYSEQYSYVTSAVWSHSKIIKIRFKQPWDSINYIDYISIRYE